MDASGVVMQNCSTCGDNADGRVQPEQPEQPQSQHRTPCASEANTLIFTQGAPSVPTGPKHTAGEMMSIESPQDSNLFELMDAENAPRVPACTASFLAETC